jgi:hypothetical protein
MLSEIGMISKATGGVLFYKVPSDVLDRFKAATAHEMAQKYAAASFATLIIAASKYVDGGFPLAKLGPQEAQHLNLLTLPESRPRPLSPPNLWQNLWLGSRDGLIDVGIFGNYQDLEFLTHCYGLDAVDIFFPFPKPLSKRRKSGYGMLLITFTPQGLRRAASQTNSPKPTPTKSLSPIRRRS